MHAIGAFFTPEPWAHYAIRRYKLDVKFRAGLHFLDPSMGNGALLRTLLQYSTDRKMAAQLHGIELNPGIYQSAMELLKADCGDDFPDFQFIQNDFLFQPPGFQADVLFGNPPWLNYNNIPGEYQEKVRPLFIEYGLASPDRRLLLGGSRIELAGLFVLKAVRHHLKDGGEAVFFLPLSLFHNEGANRYFRNFKAGGVPFKILEIIDLTAAKVFSGVGTRYGLVHLRKGEMSTFPVPYFQWEPGKLNRMKAEPLHEAGSPLCVLGTRSQSPVKNFKPIRVPEDSMPRQGINTCGANAVFFQDSQKPVEPMKPFLYPLITKENFKNKDHDRVYQYVLLPYHTNGQLITESELQHYPELHAHFLKHRNFLQQRKGKMIRAIMSRSSWYALLGVGPYNFYPWKVVWEAYGRTSFEPMIFPGNWQVNQSLQGYIPCHSLREAQYILRRLKERSVQQYLACHSMGGTMNWAQPGKIRKLLTIVGKEKNGS